MKATKEQKVIADVLKKLKLNLELLNLGLLMSITARVNKKDDKELQDYTDRVIDEVMKYVFKEIEDLKREYFVKEF
jgi:uncharacterized protein (UPF0305 family)